MNKKTDMGSLETLNEEELNHLESLPIDQQKRLIRSGYVDFASQHLILFRGDRKSFVVPLSNFKESGSGLQANFERLSFTDYGHTVKFGDYEADADWILYKFDSEYKKWADLHISLYLKEI